MSQPWSKLGELPQDVLKALGHTGIGHIIRGTKIETGITYSVPETLVPLVENYIAEVREST